MAKYILKRIAQSLLVIVGVSVLAFSVLFLSGDPTYLYVNEQASAEEVALTRQKLGFDRPIHIQYLAFASKAVRGDFGNSLRYGQPAMQVVLERLPATIELTMAAMMIAIFVAIPLGVFAATRRNSFFDGGTMLFAMVGQSIPEFWLGIMLIMVIGVQFRLLPISGRVAILEPLFAGDFGKLSETFSTSLRHLVLPALTAGLWSLSRNARLVRSSMLEVLGMDYVTTARAKGARESVVILKHAFKNALIPIVTIIGLEFGFLLGGSIVVENIFAWPGVGRLVVYAINQKDFNVVQACVIALAMVFITLNLLVDIVYTYLDPRIRYS